LQHPGALVQLSLFNSSSRDGRHYGLLLNRGRASVPPAPVQGPIS